MLEKAFKTFRGHLKFEQTLFFLLFIFFFGRQEFRQRYCSAVSTSHWIHCWFLKQIDKASWKDFLYVIGAVSRKFFWQRSWRCLMQSGFYKIISTWNDFWYILKILEDGVFHKDSSFFLRVINGNIRLVCLTSSKLLINAW